MTLLKRLGVPGFPDTQSFLAQMTRVYSGITARALDVSSKDPVEQSE